MGSPGTASTRRIAPRCLWLALAASLWAPSLAQARGKPRKAPEWSEEAGRPVVRVLEPCSLRAFVHAPEIPAGKKVPLVVVLHGHGGTPTGMLGYGAPLADARGEIWMACEGSGEEATDRGPGRSWNLATDVGGILACVDAVLERRPEIDREKVVLLGHSAGGTMSLHVLAERKAAFAGALTTAAPTAPDSRQKGARVVVTLGTRDANASLLPSARRAAEKTVVGRVVVVDGLEHDLPDAGYTAEAVDWVLSGKGGSEEIRVPREPSAPAEAPPGSKAAKAKGGVFRHVLRFATGGRGAPEGAPSRPAVRATLSTLAAEWKKAGGDFGDRVAEASEDPLSKDLRGVVTGAVLARYGKALSDAMGRLSGGDTSAPFESEAGWHVLHRDP
jgi:poly(3-hydroxybutyrate) depolymerase